MVATYNAATGVFEFTGTSAPPVGSASRGVNSPAPGTAFRRNATQADYVRSPRMLAVESLGDGWGELLGRLISP